VYPPGAAEAFVHYLKLAPEGPHAEDARHSLEEIRASAKK
jgi:hypothetical protein